MASFDSAGVTIDYLDEGEGPPVVLLHGFASNRAVNWVNTGWVKLLAERGHRVVAPDHRGHGRSQKLYDSALYEPALMADDAVRLLDHIGEERAVLMGYSMGARIAAFAAVRTPERVRALVLSGLGRNLVEGVGGAGAETIAAALEAPAADPADDRGARAFRVFAEQTRSDLAALAARIRAARQTLSEAEVARIAAPTLVVAGEDDGIAGPPQRLADLIPGARAVLLPGRDHMTAVGDKAHKAAVTAFLGRNGA